MNDIIYYSDGPIFTNIGYDEGDTVSWVEHDSVYEGTIDKLYDNHAILKNLKKLLSIDQRAKIPYWKIYDGRKPKEYTVESSDSIGKDLK